MKPKSLIFLVCLVQLCTVVSCQTQQENEKYLQAPDFLMPKGEHIQPSEEIMQSEYLHKFTTIMHAIESIWPDSFITILDSKEISKMVEILSDERIIGDGMYYDGGYVYVSSVPYGPGESWTFPIISKPLTINKYGKTLRMFPNGNGIPKANVEEIFGVPRFKQTFNEFQHFVYGNVDLIYDENGDYIGATFYFDRLENKLE